MGPRRTRKRIAELLADVPMGRRARVLGKIVGIVENSCDEILLDENAKPRSKIEAAKSAAVTLDLVLGASKHVIAEEVAMARLAEHLMQRRSATGGPAVDAHAPPRIVIREADLGNTTEQAPDEGATEPEKR